MQALSLSLFLSASSVSYLSLASLSLCLDMNGQVTVGRYWPLPHGSWLLLPLALLS